MEDTNKCFNNNLNTIKEEQSKKNAIIAKTIKNLKQWGLILSSILLFINLISLIVISSITHGTKYEYNGNLFGMDISMSIEFKGENAIMKASMNNEHIEGKNKYSIENHKFYEFNKVENKWIYIGTINSTKLNLSIPAENMNLNLDLTCKTNQTIQIISIIGVVLFSLTTSAIAILLLLNKKGLLIKSQPLIQSQDVTINNKNIDFENKINQTEIIKENNTNEVKQTEIVKEDNTNEVKQTEIVKEDNNN